MTAAYRAQRRWYHVDQSRMAIPCSGLRPNKLAAGMTVTRCRKGTRHGEGKRDGLTLSLFGTCDPLARTNRMKTFRQRNFKQVYRWVRKSAANG